MPALLFINAAKILGQPYLQVYQIFQIIERPCFNFFYVIIL